MATEDATAPAVEPAPPKESLLTGWNSPRLRTALVWGLPVVYVVALAWVCLADGLPVARDQLFLWLGLGMAAFTVSTWRSWGAMVLEWLPFFGLLVLYDYLRGAVSVGPAQAHVLPQIDLDRWLFGGELPTVWLQRHLWDPLHLHWYDYGAWSVYLTHFFAVWVVAAVIWKVARPRFRRYVVLTVLVTLGAFLIYWLYPAQPPWLAGQLHEMAPVDRIVPTVWGDLGVKTIQSVYESNDLVNLVAAMPSLHAAYPLMLLLFFWSSGWWVRIALGLYTLAMAFTLVYGGEHFFTDILAGWAVSVTMFTLVTVLAPRMGPLGDAVRKRVGLPARDAGAPASEAQPAESRSASSAIVSPTASIERSDSLS